MATSPASVTCTTGTLATVGVPPNHAVARLTYDGDPVFTLVVGYIADRADGDDDARITAAGSSLWDMRDTGKLYPNVVYGGSALNAGDRISASRHRRTPTSPVA